MKSTCDVLVIGTGTAAYRVAELLNLLHVPGAPLIVVNGIGTRPYEWRGKRAWRLCTRTTSDAYALPGTD